MGTAAHNRLAYFHAVERYIFVLDLLINTFDRGIKRGVFYQLNPFEINHLFVSQNSFSYISPECRVSSLSFTFISLANVFKSNST